MNINIKILESENMIKNQATIFCHPEAKNSIEEILNTAQDILKNEKGG